MKTLRTVFALLMTLACLPMLAVDYVASNPTEGGEYYVLNVGKSKWLGKDLLSGITDVFTKEKPQMWVVTPVEGGYNLQQKGEEKYVSITDSRVAGTTVITAKDNDSNPSVLTIAEADDAYSISVPNLYRAGFSLREPARDATYYLGYNNTFSTLEGNAKVENNSKWIFVSKLDYDKANAATPSIKSNVNNSILLGDVKANAFELTPADATVTLTPEGVASYEDGTLTALAEGVVTVSIEVEEGYHGDIYYKSASETYEISIIELATFKNAIEEAEGRLTLVNNNIGFLPGQYTPAEAAPLADAVAQAKTLLNNIEKNASRYLSEEAINKAIEAMEAVECQANEEEQNAISKSEGEINAGKKISIGGTGLNAMPLQGNTLYTLSVDYTGGELNLNLVGPDKKTLFNETTDNQAAMEDEEESKHYEYIFYTGATGNYTLNVTAIEEAVNYSNLTLMTAPTVGDEMKGADLAEVEESQEFFIYNMATGLFLNNKNTCDNGMPTLWTVTRTENGTWTITSNGNAVNVGLDIPKNEITLDIPLLGPQTLGGYSSAHPEQINITTNAAEASAFIIEGNANGYTIANEANWKYFNFEDINISNIYSLITSGGYPAEYTSYIYTAQAENGVSALKGSEYPSLYNARWKFITKEEYEKTEAYRAKVIATFKQTLAETQEQLKGIQNSAIRKGIATAMLTKALTLKGLIDTPIVNLFVKPATSTIVSAIDECAKAVEYAKVNSTYYLACKEAVENMSKLSSGIFVKGLVLAANSGLELSLSTTAMDATMFTLRAGATLYAQTVKSWAEGQDFTGFIGNNSFSTENTNKWMALDLAQMANLVPSIKDIMDKAANIGIKLGEGGASVENGVVSANSSIVQAVVALPEGKYRFSADMATSKLDKAYLHATIIESGAMIESIQKITSTVNISFTDAIKLAAAIINQEPIFDIISQIGNVAEIDVEQLISLITDAINGNGNIIHVNGVNGEGMNEFVENSLEFDINGKAIVILGASAQNSLLSGIGSIIPGQTIEGIDAILGMSAYKADNFRLNYIQNPVKEETAGATSVFASLRNLFTRKKVAAVNANEIADAKSFVTFVSAAPVSIDQIGECEVYRMPRLSEDGKTVVLERINTWIPAGMPVIVRRSINAPTCELSGWAMPITEDKTNYGILNGTYAGTSISNGFVLAYGNEGLAFYRVNGETTINSNECYIPALEGVQANVLYLPAAMTSDATAIAEVLEQNNENTTMYNVAGQRVNDNAKGLIIVKGKKMLKK